MGQNKRAVSPTTSSGDADHAAWEDLVVAEEVAGQRLDRALAGLRPDLSRTRAQAAIKAGEVTVDGKPAKPSAILEVDQRLALAPTLGQAAALAAGAAPQPEDIPLASSSTRTPSPRHRQARRTGDASGAGACDWHAGQCAAGPRAWPGGQRESAAARASSIGSIRIPRGCSSSRRTPRRIRRWPTRCVSVRWSSATSCWWRAASSLPSGTIDAPIGRDPRTRLRMALVSEAHGGRAAAHPLSNPALSIPGERCWR